MGLASYLIGEQAAEDKAAIPEGIQAKSRLVRNMATKKMEKVFAKNMGEQRAIEEEQRRRHTTKFFNRTDER